MGFGFIEVGTVTPRPQPGNPRPRLFRLPSERALINRMGFNNGGAAAAAERVRLARTRLGPAAGLIGVNIGKNKDTDLANAAADYLSASRRRVRRRRLRHREHVVAEYRGTARSAGERRAARVADEL